MIGSLSFSLIPAFSRWEKGKYDWCVGQDQPGRRMGREILLLPRKDQNDSLCVLVGGLALWNGFFESLRLDLDGAHGIGQWPSLDVPGRCPGSRRAL